MARETVTLNAREQQRAMVLNLVEREGLTGEEAAGLMGLSLRQVRRLLAAYRKEGVAALAHGPSAEGRPTAGPPDLREHQESGSGVGLRSLQGVEPLPSAGGLDGARGAGAKPVFPVAHSHHRQSAESKAAPAAPAPPTQRAVSPGGDVAPSGREPPRLAARPRSLPNPGRSH